MFKKLVKIITILQISLISIFSAYSQEGSISGKITDSESGNPLVSASVVLLHAKDSSQAGGVLSNTDGSFKFINLSPGRYFLKVTYIGYKTRLLRNINLSSDKLNYSTGEIKLSPESLKTSEITVTADKEGIEYQFDKKVINVDKSLVSLGGSAVDVLRNTPSVNVDMDGNITLRGSSSVRILIDGKARASSQSGISMLEMIPANAIEQIEIVTNPSARYEAEGSTGVINIVLKKDRADGLNGIFTVNAGTNDKYGGSANLNYKLSKFNIFANYSYKDDRRSGYGNMYREAYSGDTIGYLNQKSSRYGDHITHLVNPGFDYNISPHDRVSLSAEYRYSDNSRVENSNYNQNSNIVQTGIFTNNKNQESSDENSYDMTLSYRRAFAAKGHELNADLMYSLDDEPEENISQNLTDNLSGTGLTSASRWKTYNNDKNSLWTAQLDYSRPFNGFRLEGGYKSTFRSLDNDFNYYNFQYPASTWIIDIRQKNHFVFDEKVHAVYGIFSDSIQQFRFQLGLRYEYTITNGNQLITNQKFRKEFGGLFPTLHLSYALSELHKVHASYTRRINRPGSNSLNPIVNYHDSLSIFRGNSDLNPEYINAFELGFDNNLKFISLTSNIFYRQTNDMMSRYRFLREGGIFENTWLNIARGINYGVEFIASSKIGTWLRLSGDYSYFKNIVEGTTPDNVVDNESYSWTGRLNAAFMFFDDLSFQITGSYRSPTSTAQGTRYGFYSVDLGGKYELFNRKLQVFARLSDLFNTSYFKFDNRGPNYKSTNEMHRESRIFIVGLTFRLNAEGRQQERKRKGDSMRDDEGFE